MSCYRGVWICVPVDLNEIDPPAPDQSAQRRNFRWDRAKELRLLDRVVRVTQAVQRQRVDFEASRRQPGCSLPGWDGDAEPPASLHERGIQTSELSLPSSERW